MRVGLRTQEFNYHGLNSFFLAKYCSCADSNFQNTASNLDACNIVCTVCVCVGVGACVCVCACVQVKYDGVMVHYSDMEKVLC